VAKDSLAEKGGIQVGDRLVKYDAKPILSPLTLFAFEGNTFGKQDVEIELVRDEKAMTVRSALGSLGIEDRPILKPAALALYTEAMGKKDAAEQAALLQKAAVAQGADVAGAWLTFLAGRVLKNAGKYEEAVPLLTAAEAGFSNAGDRAGQSWTLFRLSECYPGRPSEGAVFLRRMMEMDERDARVMWVAQNLIDHGNLAANRGDLVTAESYYRRSLETAERLAPGSMPVASSLNNLGIMARDRGDLATAEGYHRRSLEIAEKLAPGSLDVAAMLNNLGIVARDRGDLAMAESYYKRSLEIVEKLAPGSLDVARSLDNLGLVAYHRGDLATAESYHKRSLQIAEKLAPGSMNVAASLNNLGNVARSRGDLVMAESYHMRSLEIKEKLAPESMKVASSLNNLGAVASVRGDLAKAESYYKHSLAIAKKLAPESLDVANTLNNLGAVASARGDLATAESYYERSLGIREKLVPNSLDLAEVMYNLGVVAYDRGDLATAENYHKRSLQIAEKLAPGSMNVAASLNNLGAVASARGDLATAEGYLLGAARISDAQRTQISSHEGRSLFAEKNTSFLANLVQIEAKLGKNGAAYHTLERLRGRGVAEQMAAHGLDHKAGAPPELLKEQDGLLNEMNISRTTLIRFSDRPDGVEAQAARAKIEQLGVKQRELDGKFRLRAPKYALIKMPQSLDLPGVQATLDEGTLLLAYFIGDKESLVFVITKAVIKSYAIAKDAKAVEADVKNYRDRIESRRDITSEGKSLYDLLLGPAQKEIDTCKRLLISPDGALNRLPFSALVVEAKPADRGVEAVSNGPAYSKIVYLSDIKPIHQTISMTVYAETLKLRGRKPAAQKLLAFGDPDYDAYEETSKERAAKRGLNLERLPATKVEVEEIAKILGSHDVLVSSKATETAAKTVAHDARYVHFACHGLLGGADPLNSSLALTKDEKNDGFLTAWEVMQMELSTDLVTLSACQTALGEVTVTEGVVGLTRSLLFAGARSVASSLWKVQDDPTACLMIQFYRNLTSGMTKDVALQRAMKTVRETKEWKGKKPDWSHPKYWAAFTLTGDWK